MKPFSLEEYLKNPSKKVITKSGNSVRILATDLKSSFPVVAAVTNRDNTGEYEVVRYYTPEGISETIPDNIYFASEEKSFYVNVYKYKEVCDSAYFVSSLYKTQEEATHELYSSWATYVTTVKITFED